MKDYSIKEGDFIVVMISKVISHYIIVIRLNHNLNLKLKMLKKKNQHNNNQHKLNSNNSNNQVKHKHNNHSQVNLNHRHQAFKLVQNKKELLVNCNQFQEKAENNVRKH